MAKYISDLETDGFVEGCTKVHCAVLKNIETGEVLSFQNHEMADFIALINDAERVVGHNWIKFDHEVLRKLYPDTFTLPEDKVLDTLVLGRLLFPDIKQKDYDRAAAWRACKEAIENDRDWFLAVPREFPGQMIGRHSLEAWGYRLGLHKGDYSANMKAQGLDPWASWNQEMHDYMVQDAEVTQALLNLFLAQKPNAQSVKLEHRIAWLCAKMERNGYPFDMVGATALYGQLVDEREALRVELTTLFPNWKVRLPDFIPARNNATQGYVKGVPVERWKEMEFNPASRTHIISRLKDKYDWKPTRFTQEMTEDPVTKKKIQPGSPAVDDEVLSSLPYPEAKRLARFFLLDKRISQLAEGKQAWMKVQREGKIHAAYNTNGAVTGRATHSKPNISQVPRVSSEFGRECRTLFHVPKGWKQLGADQAGLELRCLASDMAKFDGGAYAKVVTEGDVHTVTQKAAGLSTRDQAKTFIYAFLYGAGDAKIGSISGGGASRGKLLKAAFLSGLPALGKLISEVRASAASLGYVLGIDKRKMPCRSAHAALNTRLQNSGAVICKQWGVDWDDALQAEGLKHGWDGDYVFLSWSHDEYQLAVQDNPDLIALVSRLGVEAGRNAGQPYSFQCPLDVDVKVGDNWAECH